MTTTVYYKPTIQAILLPIKLTHLLFSLLVQESRRLVVQDRLASSRCTVTILL